MLLHGFLHAFTGKSKYPLLKCKHILPIWILMYILTTQVIAQTSTIGEYKAVFSKPCTGLMTLNSPVPNLSQFTLCTYIKLESSVPWTAFTYQLTSAPSNLYEIGLLGDSSSIKIWMFGTQITVLKSLNLNTWYELCITWSASTKNMGFHIDGILQDEYKLENSTMLQGGGSVVLGCSKFVEANSTTSVGLVGELYMFRMWRVDNVNLFKDCNDGNVIKWDMANWIYSPDLVQRDTSLHCAKKQSGNPTQGQISNSIHRLQKRAANGSVSTTPPDQSTTLISATVPEISNTSSSDIVWMSTSSGTKNVNDSSPTPVNEYITTSYKKTTSVIGGSNSTITPVNEYMTTDSKNTTTVWDVFNSSITTVSANVTTDYRNTTTGNMTCIYNATTDFQNLYANICNSDFPCNGRVYEVILEGACGDTLQTTFGAGAMNYLYNITILPSGCRVLVNSSDIICLGQSLLPAMNLSLKEKNIIDYCCCIEECRQPECFQSQTLICDTGSSTGTTKGQTTSYRSIFTSNKNNGTTSIDITSGLSTISDITSGLSTISDITSGLSTISDITSGLSVISDITNGSSTASKNITVTTVNGQPSSTTKNIANATFWRTESYSMTTTDSNATTNSGTSVIITSSSSTSKTTVNGGSTTLVNRKSSTTVNRTPTTSHTSDSSTSHKKTDFISLNTISSEFITSSSPTNLSAVIDRKVSYLEDLLTKEVNVTVAEEMVGILNSLLNTSPDVISSFSSRLIKVVDKMALKLNFPGQSVNLTSENLALAVTKVNSSYFTETSFGVESSSGLQVTLDSQLPENSAGSVVLPASLINGLSSADKDIASRVQFNYFAKTSFFTDTSLTANQYLVSNVISSSVANLTVTNLKENVTVTLKTAPTNDSGVIKCVFWDFTKNSGNGGWSSEGCTASYSTQNNINETICKCNHLTSFGILLDMTPNNQVSPEDKLILTFITYIGCGLSAIFLSVTLVTYIAFEKIRRDYPSKILIQLCAALIGLNLTFLMDPWIALYSEVPGLCISVAAFLHYFLLVSITWMGLEAFHMYLSLVKVFNTYVRKYILKFCIIGWGAPAVVVAIILAVNKDLYELQVSEPYPNGSADYFCWMKPIIYWITVVGYFCIIFLLNVSMFVVVLIQLCRIKKQKQLGYQRKTFLQDVRSVAGITFLLGITWGLGFFSFGPGKTVVQYLFTIFNSLQGFFIFFFYCVAKENVRKQWRRYLCCGKFRLAENSDWSKTATNKLKNQTSKQGISSSSSNSIQSTSNTNSTTLLVSNEYLMHPNGNGNVVKERNGVTFMPQNGDVQLQEFPGRPHIRNGDTQRTSTRRTSNRGSVHFVDQI